MENKNVDPDTEYIKICRYEFCKERFEAHHMLQSYCPEKDGISNYCKNRQKRLDDAKKKEAQETEAKKEAPPPTLGAVEPAVLPKDPVMEAYQVKSTQRDLTIKFIIARLGAYNFIDIAVKTLDSFGIDLTGYDHKKYLPEKKRDMLVFGTYGVIWIDDHLIRFTNLI